MPPLFLGGTKVAFAFVGKPFRPACSRLERYIDVLEGNHSVGLGGGNPAQWKAVADIAKEIKENHFNQVFSAVGYTRAKVGNETSHINALVSPTGMPGMVKISIGPLSKDAEAASIPAATAIAMIKEIGGNSIKFFPMGGLGCRGGKNHSPCV